MGFAIMGGAILAGSVISGVSAQNAANTQANAAGNALTAQEQMFQQQMAAEQPYMQAGYGALNQIQSNMASYNRPFTIQDFYANQDPGYQFNLQQGQKALQTSAAASGGIASGGELAALSNYSQNMASNEYQNAFQRYQTQINNSYNRLASVAQLGQTGIQAGIGAGTAASQGISNTITGLGNAQAAGQVGVANALSGGISQGIGAYQGSQLINALGSRGGGGNLSSIGSGGNLTQLTEPQLGSSAGFANPGLSTN